MAFIDNIVKFHTFSKSTVRPDLTLGEAVNPSGHTVTSKQVRTDDIPAFINSFKDNKTDALAWAAENVDAYVRHNDILYYGSNFNMGFDKPSCLKRVAKQEVNGKLVDLPKEQHTWVDFDLTSATKLPNADGKDVIAIHKDAKICYVHKDNNASTNSNENSAFIKKADGTFLDHFIAPTDQFVGGQPSLGYGLCLFKENYNSGKAFSEGESTYISNAFAGLIHFMTTRTESSDKSKNYEIAGFSVNCFEYIGDKLDKSISNIRKDVQDIIGTTMEGVVASVGVTDAAASAGISVDDETVTSPKIDITTATVDEDGAFDDDKKLVTGKAVADYVAGNATVTVNGVETRNVAIKSSSVAKTDTTEADIVSIVVDNITKVDGVDTIGIKATVNTATWNDKTQSFDDEDALLVAGVAQTVINNTIINQITEIVGPVPEGQTPTIGTAIEKAIENATLADTADNDAIANSSSTGEDPTEEKLVTAGQVKDYVEKHAQVTVTDGTTDVTATGFEFAGSAGDDITITATLSEVTTDGKKTGKVTYGATLSTAELDTDGSVKTDDKQKVVTAAVAEAIVTKAVNALSESGGAIADLTTRVGEAEANADASAKAASASQTAAEGAQSEATAAKTAAEKAQAAAEKAQGEAEAAASDASTSAQAATQSASDAAASAQSATKSASDAAASAQSAAKSEAAATQAAADALAAKEFVETTADWQAGTDDTLGKFSDDTASGVVTGTTVKTVADEVLTLAKAYSDGLHSTNLVYVVLGDNETLPTASAETVGKIYLVKEGNNANGENKIDALSGSYVEYMTRKVSETEYAWEKIGTTDADLSAYAKKAELNVTSTTANGLTYSQTNGVVSVSVDAATTSKVGTVQLTSGYTANDETKAATGKSIAAAIETLDATDVGSGAVKVSQANGIVTTVSVATEALVDNNAIKENATSDTALITAKDALAAIKLAKPENYVASVTGYTNKGAQVTTTQGAAVKVLDGRGTSVTAKDLWGTTATMDANGVVTIAHDWVTNPNASSAWNESITKVENNKAYVYDTLYGNIQTERIKNGYCMFYGCSNLESFKGDLSNLTDGSRMFDYCSNLTTFNSDLSSLTKGEGMFAGCSQFKSFDYDLSSLKDGENMFAGCENLETFTSDLPCMTKGRYMFYKTALSSFSSDLSSMTDGENMFYGCTNLESFSSDMSSLKDATQMFFECDKLESFNGDLSSLTNGENMFYDCPNLTTFNGDLSSLTNGNNMFYNCKLDTESVELIADTINDVTGIELGNGVSKTMDIHIGNDEPNDEEDAAFKQMQDKGWDVFVNGSGSNYVPRTGEASLDETGETTVAPKPYWAKPIEVTEEEAQFVGQDGKFYQVVGGQFIYVTDPDTYGMFTSREDAIANMRLTKYVKPVEEA